MLLTTAPPSTASTAADHNFNANLRALRQSQPDLQLDPTDPDVEWLFGRDGALTALLPTDHWHSGSSLPLRTARTILGKMQLQAAVTCYLAPTHAAQLRVTLDRMTPSQSLIAAIPQATDLRLMLGCENFSPDIAAGRLWFAAGDDWESQLQQILERDDGLTTPGQFVRTSLVDDDALRDMIATAQRAFARESTRRTAATRSLFITPTHTGGVCVVAPQRFRLWEDVGDPLADIAHQQCWAILDPDDPRHASPLAFARAVAGRDAVLLANLGRADLPADLPTATRVITWVTGPRVPQPSPAAPHDALLLVDERSRATALAAGWPKNRVALAAWPTLPCETHGAGLAIITDTCALAVPAFDLSSHRVLWDTIARELADDPFAAGDDAAAYLARWVARAGIAADTVDRRQFIDRLICPAYAQGLARWLIAANIDLKLCGQGWGQIPEFAPRHAGPITDRQALATAIASCAALVYAWPARFAHPIQSASRPVLHRGFKGRELWLAQAKHLSRGHAPPDAPAAPPLSAQVIRQFLDLH